MSQVLNWIAEFALALLLVGTLGMTLRLDRALRVVRRDRTAFEALISNLGSATAAVKHGIQALRGEAERAAGLIERRSEEADKMATDLSFLIEAADRAGAKLEERLLAVPRMPADSSPAPGARATMNDGVFSRVRQTQAPVAAPADQTRPSDGHPTGYSNSHSSGALYAEPSPPVPRPPAAPSGLRERAGITTRPRAVASAQAATAAGPQIVAGTRTTAADFAPVPMIVAETGEHVVRVKLVG